MSDTVSALVLPVEAVASSEPQNIGGLPGRWFPGQAYLPAALGMTLEQATTLIADHQLPLEVVQVDPDEALSTFEYAAGSRSPTGAVRTVVPAGQSPDPIVNEQGDHLMTPPTPPPTDNPPWVEATIARNDAYARGEQVAGDSPITTAMPGVPLAETPDVGLSAPEAEPIDYDSMLKPELQELAERRGIDADQTAAKLRVALAEQDAAPSRGPVELIGDDSGE